MALLLFRALLSRDPPAAWTDNRLEQAKHFKGIIYLAVREVAKGLAGATAKVSRLGRRREYVPVGPDDPLADLLAHPNPQYTLADLLTQWVVQQNLTGTALLWGPPNKWERPAQLWVVPTALCQAVPMSPQHPLGAWRVMPGAAGYGYAGGFGGLAGGILPAEEVFDHRLYNPVEIWDGYSPLTAGGVQLDVLESIDLALKNDLDSSFAAKWLVLLKGAPPDEVARVQAIVSDRYGGARNAGQTVVADADGVDLKALQTSRKDMDYQAARQAVTEFCLSLFGVPAAVLMGSNTSYSQLYASIQQFHTLTLAPLAHAVGQFLTQRVARKFYGDDYKVELVLPPVNDPELSIRWLSAGSDSKTRTVNEIRAEQKKPPLPDGDVIPSVYEAKQMAAVQAAQQQQQQPQPPRGADGQPPDQGADPAVGDPGDGGDQDPILAAVMAAMGAGDAPQPAAPVTKAVPGAGFTGVKRDGRGRRQRYQDGRHVPLGEANPDGGSQGGGVGNADDLHKKLAADPGLRKLGLTPDILAKMSPDAVRHLADQLAAGGEPTPGTDAPAKRAAPKVHPELGKLLAAAAAGPPDGKDAEAWAADLSAKLKQWQNKHPDEVTAALNKAAGWVADEGADARLDADLSADAREDTSTPATASAPVGRPDIRLVRSAGKPDKPESGPAAPPSHPAKSVGAAVAAALIPTARRLVPVVRSIPPLATLVAEPKRYAKETARANAQRVADATGLSVNDAFKALAHALYGVAKAVAAELGRGVVAGATGRTPVRAKPYRPPGKSGVPRPRNPAGKGSLPKRTKAMSAYDAGTGGVLVSPPAQGVPVKPAKPRVSWVGVYLTGEAADRVRDLAAMVADEDLAGNGREDAPHITARWGLHADSPVDVRQRLTGFGPVRLSLGRVSVFPPSVSSDGADVLKIDVDSPDLQRLHGVLGELPNTSTFPDYKPHSTIAYVAAGKGREIADRLNALALPPVLLVADRVTFSDADKVRTDIPLAVTKAVTAAGVDSFLRGLAKRKRRKVRTG